MLYAAVVSRRDIVGVHTQRVVSEGAELYLAVTKHVWVGRSARPVFRKEVRKHSVKVLLCKVHAVKRYVKRAANALHVGIVGVRRAYAAPVRFLPVKHIKARNVVTLFFQKERGHGRIHPAAHSNNNAFRHNSPVYR